MFNATSSEPTDLGEIKNVSSFTICIKKQIFYLLCVFNKYTEPKKRLQYFPFLTFYCI